MPEHTFLAQQNLVLTDNFASGITGWNANLASGYTLTQNSGRLKFTSSYEYSGPYKAFATIPGKRYRIKFTLDRDNTPAVAFVARDDQWNNIKVDIAYNSGTFELIFIATTYETRFHTEGTDYGVGGSKTFYLDDVIIEEVLEGYAYGFNGKEGDDETGTQDYGMRVYDIRLGRFLSVDPLTSKFAFNSPYLSAGNSPINFIDKNGGYQWDPSYKDNPDKKALHQLLTSDMIKNIVSNNPMVKQYLKDIGKLSDKQLEKALTNGNGPMISVMYPDIPVAVGQYDSEIDLIMLSPNLIRLLNSSNKTTRELAQMAVVITILHETIHWGRDQKIDPLNKKPNQDFVTDITTEEIELNRRANQEAEEFLGHKNVDPFEAGSLFEIMSFGVSLVETERDAMPKNSFDSNQLLKNAEKIKGTLNKETPKPKSNAIVE